MPEFPFQLIPISAQIHRLEARDEIWLKCPLCGRGLRVDLHAHFYTCGEHAFSKNAQGYVDLRKVQRPTCKPIGEPVGMQVLLQQGFETLSDQVNRWALASCQSRELASVRLVQLGCGRGHWLARLRRYLLRNLRVFMLGLDTQTEHLAYASAQTPAIHWMAATRVDVPILKQKADLALVVQERLVVQELVRILPVGGHLLWLSVASDNFGALRKQLHLAKPQYEHLSQRLLAPHFRLVRQQQLEIPFVGANLSAEEMRALCAWMGIHLRHLPKQGPHLDETWRFNLHWLERYA
ncbi:hypothetical protein SAMN05421831_102207 [Allopseudospirillum japonicum]|uniref:23S rRNA (Guanine745-N1)-methyltransferase n=1 Tax=Allopseudospirillum japonicum TaxID=64971 RepID=A0A1H6QTJ5_9GAMM|nr:hypothetical protein [Allopseudospirillum japonicum]SEI47118.1 hypothetical protein SAMN05421831_102207 [Allopseudospirillum japonicum]